tara:strand:- start:794 stop:1600 length:807 start_codon:yes stop_codon:yes gene_type:complete
MRNEDGTPLTNIAGTPLVPLTIVHNHEAVHAYYEGFEYGSYLTLNAQKYVPVTSNTEKPNPYWRIFDIGATPTWFHDGTGYEKLKAATYNCAENPYSEPSAANDFVGGGGCIVIHDPDKCVYGDVVTAQGCTVHPISAFDSETGEEIEGYDFEATLEDLGTTYGTFPSDNTSFETLTCPNSSDAVIIPLNTSGETMYTILGESYSGDFFYQSNASFYSGTTLNVGERLYFRNELLRKGLIAITNIDKLVLEFKNIKEKINKICTFTNP